MLCAVKKNHDALNRRRDVHARECAVGDRKPGDGILTLGLDEAKA